MDRFNSPLVVKGLTAYAIERQNGYERHQPEGAPIWREQRRFWTDAILQGMARLEGQAPDPELLEQFDRELELARGSFAAVPASTQLRRKTIQSLRNFVSALEAAGDDRRRQVNVVRELLEDIASHLPWSGADRDLALARDEAERVLCRMTAQMPIRFTRILLGGDAGPGWETGFVSGSVTSAEAVRQTELYRDALRDYPEVTSWPAICTVYVGGDLRFPSKAVNASAFDLEIMNRAGDRFLEEQGVCCAGGIYQMTIPSAPEATQAEETLPAIEYPRLQGCRLLEPEDLDIQERVGAESGWLTFRLDVLADEEAVLGRQLSSEETDTYVQAYTSYNQHTGQVDDTLDIVARSPGGDEWFSCTLTPEAREALKEKMELFCAEEFGERLPGPPEQGQDMGIIM